MFRLPQSLIVQITQRASVERPVGVYQEALLPAELNLEDAKFEEKEAREAYALSWEEAEKLDIDMQEADEKATRAEEIATEVYNRTKIAIYNIPKKDGPDVREQLTRTTNTMADLKKAKELVLKAHKEAREAEERWDAFVVVMRRKSGRVEHAMKRVREAQEDLEKIRVLYDNARQNKSDAEAKEAEAEAEAEEEAMTSVKRCKL